MFSIFSTGHGLEIAGGPVTCLKKSVAGGWKANSMKDEMWESACPTKHSGNSMVFLSGPFLALETPYSDKFHKYIFYVEQM